MVADRPANRVVPADEHPIYTSAPPLQRGWLAAAGQLLAWLFLRPTAWHHQLARCIPGAADDLCLAALPPAAWRNAPLQRLLLLLYFVPSTLLGLLISVAMASGWLTELALWGWLLGTLIGLLFGTLISMAAGAPIGLFAALILSMTMGRPGFIMLDLFDGTNWGLLFGAIGAIALAVTGNLTNAPGERTTTKQMGSFLLGFLASLVAAAGLIALLVLLIQARQDNRIGGDSIGLLMGSAGGILLGLVAGWRAHSWRSGVTIGLLIGVVLLLALGDAGQYFAHNPGGYELITFYALIATLIYLLLFTVPYLLARRLAGNWAGVVAGALGGLLLHPALGYLVAFYAVGPQLLMASVLTLLGLTIGWWRPLLFYPLQAAWNTLLLRRDEERDAQSASLLRWHSALWDEQQRLPFANLDAHLLLLLARNPIEGQAALDCISRGRQRWAARAVQIELDARRLERCTTLAQIAEVRHTLAAGDLEGPASALLRRFSSAGNDVAVGMTQTSSYNRRLVLTMVEQDLNGLLLDLLRTTDPYAQRFQPIAQQWRQLVAESVHQSAIASAAQGEIPNPYVVGVPLTKQQGIFVGRTDVSARIEQLLQDTNHPPLLLYGQRRMGKTSLLYNLRWLLPKRIIPLVVDLQGPVALATDHASFLYNIAKAISTSARQQQLTLPQLSREALAADPFTLFDDWLDQIETAAVAQGHSTLLLAMDEFEALDSALRKGRLSAEAVLGTLRHIIQHRERFKLLLAGSHTLEEFAHWSSYLINAQMIHLSYLRKAEAMQLIERPLQDFVLRYTAAASRRVLAVTQGHPYLVQLLCSELITRKNEEPLESRYLVTVADVEATIPVILTRGRQFFADIALHQVDPAGLRLLQQIARAGEGSATPWSSLAAPVLDPIQLQETLLPLLRRELLAVHDDGYCFQVELIRRWFAQPHG